MLDRVDTVALAIINKVGGVGLSTEEWLVAVEEFPDMIENYREAARVAIDAARALQ